MKDNLNFKERTLTLDESKFLVSEIKNTSNITGYTEKEWQKFFKTIVCEDNGNLAGVCTIAKISNHWYEIAVIYVKQEYRGQGIGTQLFELANNYLEGRNIYCSSRNPTIIKLMEKKNYTIYNTLSKLPLTINLFNIKWILSIYRLKEGFRKKYMNKSMNGFVYGIKTI